MKRTKAHAFFMPSHNHVWKKYISVILSKQNSAVKAGLSHGLPTRYPATAPMCMISSAVTILMCAFSSASPAS